MKISIITLFPNMIDCFMNESIVKRAQEKKIVEINIINLRDFAVDDYGSVDDRPYGGGPGMILRVDVLYKAIQKVKNQRVHLRQGYGAQEKVKEADQKSKIVLTSAQGKTYNQQKAREYAELNHLILIAGHYEGVDERILDYVDEEISLGDFIMTGGEIVSCAIADSVVRLLKGTLKKADASRIESFSLVEGNTLLEYPQYTRPEIFMGKRVPDILLSGNHEKINLWRQKKSLTGTKKKRPDLLR